MKSKRSTSVTARAVLLAVLLWLTTLPQPALGWLAPCAPWPRMGTATPRLGTNPLAFPSSPCQAGPVVIVAWAVTTPALRPARSPLEATRRWAECVSAYNRARLHAKSLVPGPVPAPITLLPHPFGPCGLPPERASAPIILRRARALLPLPAPARGESR
jgi:hypothetical protein